MILRKEEGMCTREGRGSSIQAGVEMFAADGDFFVRGYDMAVGWWYSCTVGY